MSLSWVNDRVGGPCQPAAWSRALPTLQFTPSGQGGRGERRKDEVDDRRNEAVTHMSAKTKRGPGKCCQTDLTTEMGALSMTSIFVRAEILKNWVLFPHPLHGSSHHLSIWMIVTLVWFKLCCQAAKQTANTKLPNFTICLVFSWLEKLFFWDLTDERYLISSNLVSSGAQICMTLNTPAPVLIWKWRSTYFMPAAKNGA